ncbi:CGNR zinc finger domain-containing protein [Streptomyces specialis]|uniref:CGNR zinc finger domain-containing protein n=1 Tax=Streptomyces specialis TaxID=498367 RepID=UPI00073F72B3|nr:CGNR zinc finger domain-containing protein [Streptomyces specialis]
MSAADRRTPGGLVLIEELINTLTLPSGPDTLAGFAERHGLPLPGLATLREALREACVAHTGPDMRPERAAELTGLLAAAPLTLTVDAAGRATLAPAPGLSPTAAFTARVAASIAAAETDGAWARLKACEDETCRWAYYDHSPAGRRRWCSMQVCGARAKMRSYRAKRRGE